MKAKQLMMMMVAAIVLAGCSQTPAGKGLGKVNKHEWKAAEDYRDSGKWGKAVSKDFDLADFKAVRTEGHVEIVYMQDDIYSVKVFGNEEAIDQYELAVDKSKRQLDIKLKDYHYDAAGNIDESIPGITAIITAPVLEDVHVYGEGDVEFKKVIRQQCDLNIVLWGEGDVDVKDIEVLGLNLEIHGEGDVKFEKAVCRGNASFQLNGKGDLDAKVKCANANIEVNSEGDVKLNVDCNELTARCNGRGDVKLKGECNVLNKKDGPAGSIDSRGLKAKKVNLI